MLAQLPFLLDSQQGYFPPHHISARSRQISATFEHEAEPETLGTPQLLRICLISRAEAALLVLSLLLLFSIRQACSAQASHIKTFPWLLQSHFNLKDNQRTKHRPLHPVQTQTVQGRTPKPHSTHRSCKHHPTTRTWP